MVFDAILKQLKNKIGSHKLPINVVEHCHCASASTSMFSDIKFVKMICLTRN